MCKAFNYFQHFIICNSAISGWFSISVFASLVGVPVGITSFAERGKTFALAAGVKKCK